MSNSEETHDVVIVGAGIGGAALAAALARGGLDVMLLEKSETYCDRVRGEAFAQWGVLEAERLGLREVLHKAGAHYVGKMIGYDEVAPPDIAEMAAVDMAQFAPGVPGLMTIPHPAHCQALFEAADAAGAKALRGVTVTRVEAGGAPTVEFETAQGSFTARAKLVVGADGRPSQVREAFGVPIHATAPRNVLGGLMADGADGWDPSRWTIGTDNDFCYALFPMGDGRVRAYGFWPVEQRHRFAGPDGPSQFLAAFGVGACPPGEAIARAKAGGPMLSFLNNETATDRAAVEGGVLVGDAGGWSDPIIGCGLSSAYRDARMVRDVLLASGDWSPAAFAAFEIERVERRRRLRFISDVITEMFCEFGEVGRDRRRRFNEMSPTDPTMVSHLIANLAGPEAQPAEMFSPEHRAHLLGL
jgi:2-polyprenyl-6-methoxyphenol hydroxylase-like FAD-dependent oxidoreductase